MDFFCRFCLPCLPFLQPDSSSHLLPPPPTNRKTESSIASNHQISVTPNLQNATSLQKTTSSSSSYSSSLSRSDSLPISVDPTEEDIMLIPTLKGSDEAILEATHEPFLPLAVSADMMNPSSSAAEDLKSNIEHVLQSPTYTEFSQTDMTSFASDATTSSSVYQSFNSELHHSPQFGVSEAEGARHSSRPLKSQISHSQTVQKNERHSLSETFDAPPRAPSAYGSVKPENQHRQELEDSAARETERSVRRFGEGVRMKERGAEGEAGGRHGSGIWMLQKQIREQMKRNLKGITRQMKKKKRKKKP